MPEVARVALPITDSDRKRLGVLEISTLPRWPNGLWDSRAEYDPNVGEEPVQLLEGQEYRYSVTLSESKLATVRIDPSEIFIADTEQGLSGRLRTGLYTGSLPVSVFLSSGLVGTIELEVRSRKFAYLSDYRWMLRDIASIAAELVMKHFAPSEQRFSPDATRDPATLYQRFAFLKSILADESFDAALHRILARPYVAWEKHEHAWRPEQGWKGSAASTRSMARAGPRVTAPSLEGLLGQFGIPASLNVAWPETTLDNTPNRFVKFALLRWLELATSMIDTVLSLSGPAAQRGLRESTAVRDKLIALVSEELFREVGVLTQFPSNDQVIQRREGYRDVYNAYLLSEFASQLSWAGGDAIYGAGQKDVATLYEYWAFLQLAQAVSAVCDGGLDWGPLLRVTGSGSDLNLVRGEASCLTGSVSRLGRAISIELWFNRTFGRKGQRAASSWSRPMRPDCSLLISPALLGDDRVEPVWLHFDAKYRVENLLEIMPQEASSAEEEARVVDELKTAERSGIAKSDDLSKMHAYRDAIRRSAGAYVLYPGDSEELSSEYHEILPGLGAFALKPGANDSAVGAEALQSFISHVIDHVALQISQHERARYWTEESFRGRPAGSRETSSVSFLRKPPADTRVLVGFVRDQSHLDWIHRTRKYNLRADDRSGSVGVDSDALAADLVLLYCPTVDLSELWSVSGAPEVATRERMVDLGYSEPSGNLYYCVPLHDQLTQRWAALPSVAQLIEWRSRNAPNATWGAPVTSSWLGIAG